MRKLEWHESAETLTGFARALQFCFRRKWSQQRANHFLESVRAAAGLFSCVCLCVCLFLNLVFLLFIMVYICCPNWLLSGESCSCFICGVFDRKQKLMNVNTPVWQMKLFIQKRFDSPRIINIFHVMRFYFHLLCFIPNCRLFSCLFKAAAFCFSLTEIICIIKAPSYRDTLFIFYY